MRAALSADGAPDASRLFSAARARVVVGPAARDPEAWVDALSAAGVSGVEWVPSSAAASSLPAARRCAAFAARALSRLIDAAAVSDLRDELAVGLLAAAPVGNPRHGSLRDAGLRPGRNRVLLGRRLGARRRRRGGDFRLGHAATLRFQELPSAPLVPALAGALAREAQPLCASCVYRSFCVVPPSAHFRAQGGLSGRLPDSPRCMAHMALLDAVFSRLNDEKCLKALEKWDVDISRFTC